MKTREGATPVIKRGKKYEFIFEELELAFETKQLWEITKRWNEGTNIKKIGADLKRDNLEILLAIIYQAEKGVIERPFGNLLKGCF